MRRGSKSIGRSHPGPFLADAVWEATDQDHNGSISPAEAQAWVSPFLSGLSVSLDGRSFESTPGANHPLAGDCGCPARRRRLRLKSIWSFAWPAKLTGAHSLKIHNSHLESNSLNWFALTGGQGLSFDQPRKTTACWISSFIFRDVSPGGAQRQP